MKIAYEESYRFHGENYRPENGVKLLKDLSTISEELDPEDYIEAV